MQVLKISYLNLNKSKFTTFPNLNQQNELNTKLLFKTKLYFNCYNLKCENCTQNQTGKIRAQNPTASIIRTANFPGINWTCFTSFFTTISNNSSSVCPLPQLHSYGTRSLASTLFNKPDDDDYSKFRTQLTALNTTQVVCRSSCCAVVFSRVLINVDDLSLIVPPQRIRSSSTLQN